MNGSRPAALSRVAAALDSRRVAWIRLRDDDPAGPGFEADLLVHPSDLACAAEAFRAEGFIELPGRGLGTHRFFVSYDAVADQWVKLDVVTDLAFGSRRELRAVGAAEVLGRRRRTATGWSPDASDEFWALALHCLLDRGSIARHEARLAELAPNATGAVFVREFDSGLAGAIRSAARAGDEAAFLACAKAARRALLGSGPVAMSWRLTGDSLRRLGAKLALRRAPGLVVALLGPDGSGKSTLATGLRSGLPFRSRLLYGGLYARRAERRRSRLVRFVTFSVAARYEARRGSVVIADRHPLEFSDRRRGSGPKAALRRRLDRLAPAPDLTLILDCDGHTMFRRKGEHSPDELEVQRRALLAVAACFPRTTVLDARQSPDAVRSAANNAIWERLT